MPSEKTGRGIPVLQASAVQAHSPHGIQTKPLTANNKLVVDEVLQSSPNGMQPSLHKKTSIPTFVRNYTNSDGRSSPRPRNNNNNHSALCEQCRGRLAELKRQVLRILLPFTSRGVPLPKDVDFLAKIQEKLHVPENSLRALWSDRCETCDTNLSQLKQEAVTMVQSWEQEQADSRPNGGTPGHLGGARHYPAMPRTTPHYTAAHHRLVRQGYSVGPHLSPSGLLPPGSVYINNQILDWVSPKKYSQMLASGPPVVTGRNAAGNGEMTGRELVMSGPVARPMMLHGLPQQHYPSQMPVAVVGQVGSPGSASSTGSNTSAAASFFARAAQKLNISSRKKKRHQAVSEPEVPHFPTNFHEIIRVSPPPAPPCLMRAVGRMQNPGTGKVKVMLRICPVEGTHQSSFLTMDPRKKQVTVYDPSCSGYAVTAASRRTGAAAPKMFAFDAVFSQDDSLAEICASSLVEIVQAVVNGADGCLFCYGHARLGKTYTMIGVDDSPQNLGIIPCAIAWLFKLINEQKEKTGARFSVRVSAVEVTGKQERLKDLLADVATGQEAGSSTAPGVYLREDPICGTQLENQSELRAPTAERATFYLDAAVAARTVPEVEEDARNSHLLFTLHVYQYRVEKSGKASHAATNPSSEKVAGGRSRLHLVDLGSCSKSKDGNALSLSALGNVILALLNGQRHVPHRESKLTQLIRESLGNLTCRTCMIAHVSPGISAYNETLQVIQLAARIHRMRRRKNKFSSTSSEESSSCDESGRMRPRMRVGVRMGTLREDAMLSHSDPDYTSSSEQSCDTVIYVGKNGQALSDRELTDNEGPPAMVPVSPHPQGPKASKVSFTVPHSKTASKGGRTPSQGSGMRMGTTHTTNAASPAPGVVQLPRKLNVKAKPPMFAKPKMFTDGSEQSTMHDTSSRTSGCSRSKMAYRPDVGSEQWIDGPACPQTSEIQGEQWIDGPQAYNQPGSQEHWVDGPTMVQPGQQWSTGPSGSDGRQQHGYGAGSDGHDASLSKSERWIDGPNTRGRDRSQAKAPSASEMWVDGPTEFVVGSEDSRTKYDKPNKMWTEMPKQAGSAGTDTCTAPKSNETDNEISGQAPAKPLRNPAVLAAKDQVRPCSVNSDSNSNTSLAVNHSRPISTVSSDTTDRDPNSGSQLVPGSQEPQEPMCINSFVKDWVEKHSAISSDSTGGGQSYHKYPRKHHTLSIPRKDILSRNFDSDVPHHRVPMTMDDSMLFARRKLGDSERVSSCHSSPRVKHVKRSMLPPPANPLDRTFAWIKSLDGEKKKEEAVDPPSELPVTASPVHRVQVHNEEQPPPYESCVDDIQGLEVPEYDSLSDKVWYTPEELVGTPMTTSSLPEPMNNDEAAPDYTTLMLTNRESVYEIQMDEQLEAMKSENGLDTTLNSEDGSVDNFSLHKQEMLKDSSIMEESKELDYIDVKQPESDESPVDVKENLSINADAESGIASSSGGHLSPPSSDDSDKSPGKRLIRPTCLRRPDGASNPNLSNNDPTSKDDEFSSMQYMEDSSKLESETSSPEPLPKPVFPATSPSSTSDTSNLCQSEGTMQRSALGQLPEDGTPSPQETSPTQPSKLPTKTVKPPLPSKPAPPTRGSSLLKFGSKKSPNKSSELPKTGTLSKSSKSETNGNTKAEGKGKKDGKAAGKDKKNVQKQVGSPTPSSSGSNSRPSSVKSSPSRLPTGKSKSNQSSPTKSTCSSKDSKGSGKDSKGKDSGKDTKSKDSKSKASGSKIPSPTKKEKDSKVPVSKVSNNRVSELSGHKGRGTDSDSGNDSGIGKSDKKNKKLLSPYSTVTQPRVSTHSSSGHGSDASSTLSGHLKSKLSGKKAEKVQGGASSGYESMLRDSEVTGTSSSTHDSTSESSSGGRIRGTKILKKKAAGTRRSRSAPPSRTESPASSRRQSPAALGTRKTLSPASPRAWVDTRHLQRTKDEPFELKVYDVDDVERMQRRRKEEAELRALERRRERIRELLIQQEALKMELLEAKDRLMIEQSTWSFDLYVAEQMDRDDPNYLEALEKETKILEKRVDACKSHIMMVTCFDINV